MILIVGGSGSGKSAYAEHVCGKLAGASKKYYIATMRCEGEEGAKRVEKHRRMREGKSFITIECATDISKALDNEGDIEDSVVLLEDLSNLVANEFFDIGFDEIYGEAKAETKVEKSMHNDLEAYSRKIIDKVYGDITELAKKVRRLVVVSDNIFEDGLRYDEVTKLYMEALGSINVKLAENANCVAEVVMGVPLFVKGSLS